MNWTQTGLIVGGIIVVGAIVYAGVKVCQKTRLKKTHTVEVDQAKEEFASVADVFSGLYEPLYKMGKGDVKFRIGVIGDWVTRTENLSNADHYVKEWRTKLENYSSWNSEQGMAKINELLAFVFESGVHRDTVSQIVVDNASYKKYTSAGEIIEAQNPARVISPFWFVGDKILEKGIIDTL